MAKTKLSQINLHDILQNKSFDHAILCTYSFDPIFFEEYCLDKFDALNNNPNITIITDYKIYQGILRGDEARWLRHANLRYLLHPIDLPGAFHSKLFLFIKKNKGMLILGSGNFTRPGLTSNAELANIFEFEAEKNEGFKGLFRAAFEYINLLVQKWPGKAIGSNINQIAMDAAWIISGEPKLETPGISLMNNFKLSLLDQISGRLKGEVEQIYVVSRYFDSEPAILDAIYERFKPNRIKIFTQNGITTLTPRWLSHRLVKAKKVQIFLCEYRDEEKLQNLHAKAIAIKSDGNWAMAYGSANFTTPGIIKTAEQGNAELMLFIDGLADEKYDFDRIFDPCKSALNLTNPKALVTAPISPEDAIEPHIINLKEAILDDSGILCRISMGSGVPWDEIRASLLFSNDAYMILPLEHDGEDNYSSDIPDKIRARMDKSSTIIEIQLLNDGDIVGLSNRMLVINLQEFQFGHGSSKDRHIREAENSTNQFFKVLNDLVSKNDEQRLIIFLQYCDIPIQNAKMPFLFRHARPVWDGEKGMRNLGENNLVLFKNLHEATLYFFDRHFRKLQRHVGDPNPEGIPNFMHIFLSMAGVLKAQISRAICGLEAREKPLSVDEWSNFRNIVDIYLIKYESLMNCLWNEYLYPMIKLYGNDKIREEITPDFQSLLDLNQYILTFRKTLNGLINTRIKVKSILGPLLVPRYGQHCFLNDILWGKYIIKINDRIVELKSRLGGIDR